MKRCPACKQVKPYSEFYKNRSKKDGHHVQCKGCAKGYNATYRRVNGTAIRDQQKSYRAANDATIKAKRQIFRDNNRDMIRARDRRSYSPEERWVRELWRTHGMQPWDWQNMWNEQGGLCYLGQHPLPKDRGKVCIDHDHACCPPGFSCKMCRRGLACPTCNSAIGMLRDDPAFIRLVAASLERQQAAVRARVTSQPRSEALF